MDDIKEPTEQDLEPGDAKAGPVDPLMQKAEKIKELRNKIKSHSKYQKQVFEKNWFLRILFFIGNQWVTYYNSTQSWQRPRNMPDWFPTPVTNKYARILNTIIAILIQKDPVPIITPATNSDEDIATADVADKLIPIIDKETDTATFSKIAAHWYVIIGNIFCHTYAYNSPDNGTVKVEKEQCAGCGSVFSSADISANKDVCNVCGSVNNFKTAVDATGQPMIEEFPKTKLIRDACSPFEIHCEQQIQDIKQLRNFVRTKSMPLEDIKKMYPKFAAKIVTDSSGETQGQDYLNTLAFTTTNAGQKPDFLSGGMGTSKDKRGALDYLYALPDEEFPNGVVATMNGDLVLEVMPLDKIYRDKDGKAFLPLAFAGHTFVPGRLWHKSISDDIFEKQKQRNKLECFIELIIYRMCKPDWLIPSTAGNDVDVGGEPGQKITYTPGPRGEKPEVIHGADVPITLVNRLEQIDKELEDLGATYDALKGQSPTNVNTYAGLKLLTERGYSSHLSMIQNWEKFRADITLQALDIARNTMIEERQATFKNELGDWETSTFQNSDIQGGVDIKIEAGSSLPRSQAAEQAALVESVNSGLIDITDQGTHLKVLEALGQSEFKNDTDIDVKDASKEWNDFLKTGKTRPRKGVDNEEVHLKDAQRRAKTDQFFKLRPEMQKAWIEHIGLHEANVMMEQQRMAQMAAMAGAAPAGKPMLSPSRKTPTKEPPVPKHELQAV